MTIFVGWLFLWVKNLGMVRLCPVAQSLREVAIRVLASAAMTSQLNWEASFWAAGLRASDPPPSGLQNGSLLQHSRQARRTKERWWRQEGSHSLSASSQEWYTIVFGTFSLLEASDCRAHPQGEKSSQGGRDPWEPFQKRPNREAGQYLTVIIMIPYQVLFRVSWTYSKAEQ